LQSRHPKHPSAAGVNMSCSGVNMSCSRGKCAYLEPQLFFAPYVTFFLSLQRPFPSRFSRCSYRFFLMR
jgi:hypothetical protein